MRYSFMSVSLSQTVSSDFKGIKRWLLGFFITDEIFAVAAAEKNLIGRRFMYGLITLPYIGWIIGTALGVYANHILPSAVCAALGIAIYSMFMAIIIPPARDDKGVLYTVLISAIMSCVNIISIKVPQAAMTATPATCPAEVRLVIEIRIVLNGAIPCATAVIPNPKDTDKYPSANGRPLPSPYL